MSDAALNYEHTKNTVKIPHGWELIDAAAGATCEPDTDELKFWAPQLTPQAFVDFKDSYIDCRFNDLWNAGSTIIIRKMAVPPPPPPAPMPLPGFLPAPVAPVVAQPQLTTTVETTAGVSAGAPSFLPTPQIPQAAPVVPQAAPVLPPVSTAPVAPTLRLPTVTTPTLPQLPAVEVPVAPVVPTVGVNLGGFVPQPASAIPMSHSAPESEVMSDAEPNVLDAWLAALDGVKARIEALEDVKKELRDKIVRLAFPKGLREGANSCTLPDGRKLTITGVVNRTVDPAAIPAAKEKLIAAGGDPASVFMLKEVLNEPTYKRLPSNLMVALADAVTEKQGTPQLKVTEPAAKKN